MNRVKELSPTVMAEDFEDRREACIGELCFLQPYQHYTPPPYYPRIARREYRWKVGAQVRATPDVQCKISHSVALPNVLGLGPEARWRWQWIPVSLMTSVLMRIWPQQRNSSDDTQPAIPSLTDLGVGVSPRARLKVLTPVFGKLAIRPTVELLPTRKLIMKRHFRVGTTDLTVQANLGMGSMGGLMKWPHWSLQINWHPTDAVKLMLQPENDVFEMQYSRSFNLTPECKGVATGLAEVPSNFLNGDVSGFLRTLSLRPRLDSLKVSHIITDTAARTAPLPASAYLKASKKIGTRDLIGVIPGHWIDPGFESGAPGERDFNMDVANMLERQLMGNGWKVLRPDRDAPHLTWEEYLNWVSKQTSQGIPVLEIHGQGSTADYRGLVLGVIGDANAPLNRELAKDFGYFEMDWTDLGVPKRGGVVLETFNADEVLQMAPWHRKWSVRRLAKRILTCIERSSHDNRVSRGVIVEAGSNDDDILA